jgi:hypothetical protein
MTSPGLPDWDPLVVPVDDAAEPLDAGVECSSGAMAAVEPRSPALPEEAG